eukprot:363299-Chlamydomonas_euryale.AAC.11
MGRRPATLDYGAKMLRHRCRQSLPTAQLPTAVDAPATWTLGPPARLSCQHGQGVGNQRAKCAAACASDMATAWPS